jgi:NAD(P)-dependent dehydrogenase (short-subunit alcohol dehydrogenase family)
MYEDGIARDGMRTGDHIVITGGGGGFGRAFCKRLARMGARISLWDINEAAGRETEAQVRAAGGEALCTVHYARYTVYSSPRAHAAARSWW